MIADIEKDNLLKTLSADVKKLFSDPSQQQDELIKKEFIKKSVNELLTFFKIKEEEQEKLIEKYAQKSDKALITDFLNQRLKKKDIPGRYEAIFSIYKSIKEDSSELANFTLKTLREKQKNFVEANNSFEKWIKENNIVVQQTRPRAGPSCRR